MKKLLIVMVLVLLPCTMGCATAALTALSLVSTVVIAKYKYDGEHKKAVKVQAFIDEVSPEIEKVADTLESDMVEAK